MDDVTVHTTVGRPDPSGFGWCGVHARDVSFSLSFSLSLPGQKLFPGTGDGTTGGRAARYVCVCVCDTIDETMRESRKILDGSFR
jgi:hypothetical protein